MIKIILTALVIAIGAPAFAQSNFRIDADSTGYRDTLIRNRPAYVNARSLAANVNEDTTVPTGAKKVIFSATCNFYAKSGGSATVPGDVTNGSASELNPAAWSLDAGITTIGLISPAACVVTISYYL